MTTLKSLMTSDAAAGGVFLPVDSDSEPDGFNETVYFYPAANFAERTTINAVVVQDGLTGTNEQWGDGVTHNRTEGKRIRETIDIEVPASTDVRVNQPDDTPDVFKVGDLYVSVNRIMGRDNDLMTVRCVRCKESVIRSLSRTG